MRILPIVILLLASILVPDYCNAASFDCSKASSKIEKEICSADELSRLDEKLSVVYGRAVEGDKTSAKVRIEQRQWIANRDRCADFVCIKSAYEKRIGELEKIVGHFNDLPNSAFIMKLCGQLANPTKRTEILEWITGVDDVNNDGRKERVETCWGGTMNVPCFRYYDQAGKEIQIQQAGFEWKDYWTYGLRSFRYQGRTFSLHSSDDFMKKPVYLSYVTPNNQEHILCEFRNEAQLSIAYSDEQADGICEAVLNTSSDVEAVSFDEPSSELLEKPDKFITVERTGLVDINNDGRNEPVAEFRITSGAGRGCNFNYFALLDNGGTKLAKGDVQRRFLESQRAHEIEMGCGRVVNRLIKYRRKIYLERNVDNNPDLQRAVFLWLGNDAKTICAYEDGIRTYVK